MDSADTKTDLRKLIAFTLPMAVYLALLTLSSLVRKEESTFSLASPELWIYPAQTLFCGALLLWFWREYDLSAVRRIGLAIMVALLVFACWILPEAVLGFPPRLNGFNPDLFSGQPAAYWSTVLLRFLRLVVIVPLVEEIFWRGFLLRYLIGEKFSTVPMGAFSWLSFGLVTIGFGLSHSRADWIAAFLTGALYNWLAYRTKSLATCVVAHALTNLLLGLWIMKTHQWGFW
jgi:CAAX prenyl protease-like protein